MILHETKLNIYRARQRALTQSCTHTIHTLTHSLSLSLSLSHTHTHTHTHTHNKFIPPYACMLNLSHVYIRG
jgi:hypothetical protein